MKSTLTRRALLGATAGAAATAALSSRTGSALASAAATTAPAPILPADRIACQLYSVRDQVDGVGFAEIFKRLASIGYKQVEFTQYTQSVGPITLAQIRSLLKTYGLTAIGTHVSPSDDASMKKILDDAQVIGIPNVGISFEVPQGLTTSAWQALAAQWNHYGAMAQQRNIGFYFHNHFQEFAPCLDDASRRGIDVLLAETDPRYVFWEMDIYWAYVGQWQANNGFDPLLDYAMPFRNRIKLFHVKDGNHDASGGYADSLQDMCDVGEGRIDFDGFFTELFKQSSGEKTAHYDIWERDNAADHPRGSFAAAQCSFANMRYSIK